VTEDQPARPALRVVRGDPTAEELAALVTVLSARAAAPVDTATSRRSAWNEPARLVRRPVRPGTGGWQRSALPG
jgi:hypothetical protein